MRIVVLAGGTSTERDISIMSGTGICRALRQKGHQAILVDIFCGVEKVDWEDPFPQEYSVEEAEAYIKGFNQRIEEMQKTRRSFFGPFVLELCQAADIVFLGLHGENGEDGKVQAAFDLMGIRYTGTGSLSSAMAMDKAITKQIFLMNRVPTPRGVTMTKEGGFFPDAKAAGLEYPVVVKTSCGGSSVGVYIARDRQEYQEAIRDVAHYGDEVVLEEYIQGREFSVAVVDGVAYPVIEIAPISGFYDYKNKYEAGSTVETCPAKLSEELTKKMQEAAVKAAKALKLTAYSRLDFMMKENGDIYCLEANTLPGMTPTSLIPQEARALGMDYPQLCEELIRCSMKKYEG
ncbi:MAG: D-alanine--D-alanine ligase [Eubacteriales bacterium]|nr:D-alanine--D-alanine ligase [Eubacteriales bacterium]